MIIGIGTDIVEVARIAQSISKFGDKFLQRTFSQDEQKAAQKLSDATNYYAKRYAAKEAFSKALGTGIGSSAALAEISTMNDKLGAPYLTLSGVAAETVVKLAVKNGGSQIKIHISLSDEKQYAQAFVILELI